MKLYSFIVAFISPGLILGSFFEVKYPDVNISAETGGDLTFEAGTGGNVLLKPGTGGSVYIAGTDLRKFIEKVKSLPPIWTRQSVHGTLGTFSSGRPVSVHVEALDPDGGNIIYQVVSGHLPPGTHLNSTTGEITGTAPDVDATYTFGIRATDRHGKYADGSFSLNIRERDQCSSNPCKNKGNCTDDIGKYICTCPSDYGGSQCQTRCSINAFGVAQAVKTIPDAQLSAHYSYNTNSASNGRLNNNAGWIGQGAGSWLQVDLGEVRRVFAIATQGYRSSSYYITGYNLKYSQDGNTFTTVMDNGRTKVFDGSTSYDTVIKHYLVNPVQARFIRFLPTSWHSGGKPGMRVEIYGC